MSKIQEAITLSDDIIKNIELSEIWIDEICLKAIRLSKLVDDKEWEKWLNYEVSWYPIWLDWKWMPENFNIANKYTNRKFIFWGNEYYFTETITELKVNMDVNREELRVSSDPNISVSSANPNQYVMPSFGNSQRRTYLNDEIRKASWKLSKLKKDLYNYVAGINYWLKYEGTIEYIFSWMKEEVSSKIIWIDSSLETILSSIYDNLKSNNNVDWSNAVHNCRRLLYELANVLFPATNDEKDIWWWKKIKFSDENYILRLKEYILTKSWSKTFQKIVWNNLEYIGDKIWVIYNASTKWSHIVIDDKKEAERYVINTYILLSDILSL